LIPRTAAEIRRVFNLVTRAWQTIRHHLRWSCGGTATKPGPAGSTSHPACSGEQPIHDQVTKYGCPTSEAPPLTVKRLADLHE